MNACLKKNPRDAVRSATRFFRATWATMDPGTIDTPSAVSPARPASPVRGAPPADDAPSGVPVPRLELEAIRREVFELAASETLDKGAALTVTRLFHSMETLLRHECTERERRLCHALNDLEQMRLHNELERLARRHTIETVEQAQQSQAAADARGRRSRGHF
jgi:hypothetical protein